MAGTDATSASSRRRLWALAAVAATCAAWRAAKTATTATTTASRGGSDAGAAADAVPLPATTMGTGRAALAAATGMYSTRPADRSVGPAAWPSRRAGGRRRVADGVVAGADGDDEVPLRRRAARAPSAAPRPGMEAGRAAAAAATKAASALGGDGGAIIPGGAGCRAAAHRAAADAR